MDFDAHQDMVEAALESAARGEWAEEPENTTRNPLLGILVVLVFWALVALSTWALWGAEHAS